MPPSLNKQNTKSSLPTHLGSELVEEVVTKLLSYCKKHDWIGPDPYDALNSRLFRALPFFRYKTARLLFTQLVKRCPFNPRLLLNMEVTSNPKAIALFLSALIKLEKAGFLLNKTTSISLIERLLQLRSPDSKLYAWGYNFDWQTRSKLVPRGSPNIICSTFAANALLDAYEHSQNSEWLAAAVSTTDFLMDSLYRQDANSNFFFSYTPLEQSRVHNANLLGAALLSRVYSLTGREQFLGAALDATRYSVNKQHEDGSWDYGEAPSQRWIDNFHTGFNLCALKKIAMFTRTPDFHHSIHKGFAFFRDHFIRKDGAPKYFHNSTYPIDIHSVAQTIITLAEFNEFDEENTDRSFMVLAWALKNLWNDNGFFYFQKHRYYKIRTSFMRWSQAWMLLALSFLIELNRSQTSTSNSPRFAPV